jgi:peptidoglycan/xylan/chitin deacetylase (PgdA/CDA1 family)
VPRRPTVLCYHGVSDTWEDALAVTPAALEHQIRTMLRRGYVPIPASDVVSTRAKGFHVTFDDAFANIRGALERLVSFGVSPSVYACTGYADDGRPLDSERLSSTGGAHHRRTMTWDELREVVAMGVEVGSHTVSHPRLTELSDAELRTELRASKGKLEDELQRPCAFLVYPYGDQDARVRAAAREAGYSAAFADYQPFDVFAIPRVGLYRHDTSRRADFKLSQLGQLIATRRLKRR